MDFLYESDARRDHFPFGDHWCGPEAFKYGEPTLVARYEGRGDGQSVEIYCTAMPARFYTLKALPGANSVGQPHRTWTWATGSGEAELIASMALAISQGMLALEIEVDPQS